MDKKLEANTKYGRGDGMKNQDKQSWESYLIRKFELNTDFVATTATLLNQRVSVYYISSLIDLSSTMITWENTLKDAHRGRTSLEQHFLTLAYDEDYTEYELANDLLQGKMIAKSPESGNPLMLHANLHQLSRAIMPSENENPIQSSMEGFTEKLSTNVGLLRQKVSMQQLLVESYSLGINSPKELALMYIEGTASAKVVKSIKERLSRNSEKEVHTASDLLQVLEQPKYALVPTYLTSELPGETIQNLMDGKVIILVDQLPFSFSFPAIIKDLWSYKLDLNYPHLYLLFFRMIRIAGIAFAIIMPGLYVVLNSVNPELLRIQLAISVAKSREGVPYPSFVEVMLMLLLMEMVIEATTRLPKNIGPTITMVGGIILGQAIVQAKLVSNLLIIILAATTISNFTMSGYLNTIGIRIFKYFVLFICSIFGVLGLQVSLIWLFVYFASLKTFSVPYLSLSTKGKVADD